MSVIKIKSILVLHGPNLDRLGMREIEHYGSLTIDEINTRLKECAATSGVALVCKQSNSEGTLIDYVHQALQEHVSYIIINPAGYTHTSIALRDALILSSIPFIEVHLSNVYARESFRHHSYFSDVAQGTISGLGANGYLLALNHILSPLTS